MFGSSHCPVENLVSWESFFANEKYSGECDTTDENFLTGNATINSIANYEAIARMEFRTDASLEVFGQRLARESVRYESTRKDQSSTSFPVRSYSMDEAARNYVKTYVMENLVDRICERVTRRFPDADVTIDVYNDPEIDDRYLQVQVRLKDYPADFVQTLRAIQSELESSCSSADNDGYLLLTTDFARPKA